MNDPRQSDLSRATGAGKRRVVSSGVARSGKTPLSVDEIAERMLAAIMEQKLPPGTKLVEDKLAGVFSVSRTKIRQALARLAHDNVLSVYPNRGTYVASPSIKEARHVFAARRLIEPELVRLVAETATKEQVAALRKSALVESRAHETNDRRAIIRLSGEFHILLAEMGGNPFLLKSMRELASLTCLIIALYDSPNTPACPHHEHGDIVDAIRARDGERAAKLMVAHLDHVERALDLRSPPAEDVDLEAVFA